MTMTIDPPSWSEIPDLGLYMDQVITLIVRCFGYADLRAAGRLITPSMINNYVKAGLIPRPLGKKYSREQIALLLMVVALKPVCSMEDIRRLLTENEGPGVEALYSEFCRRYQEVARALQPQSAMDCAIHAAVYRMACDEMLG